MITRSLRYRFQYLPTNIKNQIITFYKEHNSLYQQLPDNTIFDREIGSIVMQIVSVVLTKGHRGELWTTSPESLSREIESKKDSKKRMNDYIRELDFNILKCDDVEIIRRILMKV